MKKALLSLVLASVLAGGVFALDMTWGVLGAYSGDFGGGAKNADVDYEVKIPTNGFGAFAFFDIKYLEVSAGYLYNLWTVDTTMGSYYSSKESYLWQTLDLAALGKFPFAAGEKVTLFPLLGIAYRMTLTSNGEASSNADLNQLWFKAGFGGDITLSDSMLLRAEALYGIRIASKFEKDLVDVVPDSKARLGHGLDIKVGVGWKI